MRTSRPPERLLMVMPYHQLVRKAVEAGFEVWSVWDPSLRPPEYLREVERHSRQLLLCDFSEEKALRALLARTAREHDIDRILHLGSEANMVPVLEEAELLGLAANTARSVHRLNDKAEMRRILNSGGLPPVRARTAAGVAEVPGALASVGLPAVVKPAASSGSKGVALVRDAAGLVAWRERAERAGDTGPFVVEEYLVGPEFSVETLSVHGMHHVVGITAKRTTGAPGFVETGHLHPAPLHAYATTEISDLVTSLLDLVGYTFGPAHTEVILTADGPRIVESQARLGGDRIPLLVETARDFDLESWIFRALAGERVTVPAARRSAAVEFLSLPPGRLVSVEGVEELTAEPWVRAVHFPFRPGDEIPKTVDSATRHGYIVVEAADPEQAAGRLRTARERLRPRVQPAGGTPRAGATVNALHVPPATPEGTLSLHTVSGVTR